MEKQKSLISNVLMSSLKTLTNIIFPLLSFPYITRILSVSDIGKINFTNSILGYFSLIAGFGISTFAIRNGSQIKDKNKDFEKFSNGIFTINVISTLISCVLLVIFVFLPTRISEYRLFILIQGVSVALSPLAVEWLFSIKEDFSYIALRNFIVQLLSLVLMFCLVRTENDAILYVIITTVAISLGNLISFSYSKRYVKLSLTFNNGWSRNKKTIFIFFVNNIASTIYLNSDITMLGIICGDTAVGLYSVATKIYFIVKRLINTAVSSIIPRAAYLAKENKDSFEKLISKALSTVMLFVIPMSFGIVLLSKEIVITISGEKYLAASIPLAIFGVTIIFAVISNVLANGLLVCLKKEKYVLKVTIISACINVLLNIFFIPWYAQIGAAITTLLAEFSVVVVCICYSKDTFLRIFNIKSLIKYLFSAFLMAFVVMAVKCCIEIKSLFTLAIIFVIGAFIYFITLLFTKEDIFLEIIKKVN